MDGEGEGTEGVQEIRPERGMSSRFTTDGEGLGGRATRPGGAMRPRATTESEGDGTKRPGGEITLPFTIGTRPLGTVS